MKFKKESILLIAVIAVLGVYLTTRSTHRDDQPLAQPAKLESAKINRLLLTGKKNTPVEMVKKDDRWFIQPQGYPVDKVKVKNILASLSEVTLTALVSESGSYERYGLVEAEKIAVQAFVDGSSVRTLLIGKTAPTYQHTFVLLEGDPKVYHARGQLGRTFDQTIDSLRDKTIFDVPKESITALTLRKNDRTLAMTRQKPAPREDAAQEKQETPDQTQQEKQDTPAQAKQDVPPQAPAAVWQEAGGAAIDQSTVDALIEQLRHLDCESFLEEGAKARLTQPVWTVTFKKAEEEFALAVFPKLDDAGEKLPATASTTPFAFLLNQPRLQTIEKQVDALLGLEAAKK